MKILTPNLTPGDLAWLLRSWVAGDSLEASKAEIDERTEDGPWRGHLAGITVHDRRADIRGAKHSRGRPRPPRAWSEIFGCTVHQTGSGELDPDHPGILSIPAHILIHTDASVSLLHPLVLRMPHAHALNGSTIGIEVDCRADGIEGDPSTFWRSKTEKDGWRRNKLGIKTKFVGIKTREMLRREATDAQLSALTAVLLYCHGAFIHNAPRKNWQHFGNYAHRQGHSSREADPGSRIAKHVDDVRRSLGLKDVSQERYGSGTPWPVEWRH